MQTSCKLFILESTVINVKKWTLVTIDNCTMYKPTIAYLRQFSPPSLISRSGLIILAPSTPSKRLCNCEQPQIVYMYITFLFSITDHNGTFKAGLSRISFRISIGQVVLQCAWAYHNRLWLAYFAVLSICLSRSQFVTYFQPKNVFLCVIFNFAVDRNLRNQIQGENS